MSKGNNPRQAPRVRPSRKDSQETASGAGNEFGDYEVGYKRPPVHSRFQPGVSGNPSGRKKRLPNITEEIQQLYLRKTPVQEGLRRRRMRKIVLLHNIILNDGLKGSRASARDAVKTADKFGVYDIREKFDLDFSVLTKEEREICFRAQQILEKVR